MSFPDAYLLLVVVAFSTFAVTLGGVSIWSRGGKRAAA